MHIAILIGIILSILTVLGDFFIKNASLKFGFSGWKELLFGSFIYALTGIGWFYVLRHVKLTTSSVVYSASCIILLTLLSIFIFKESINYLEIIGIILAITSIILLGKFS